MAINDINTIIEKTLSNLGFSKSPIGYDYLMDIFDCILCDEKCCQLQPIYLQVAFERGKDWRAVRRAVKRTISTTFSRNKNNGWWLRIFGDIETPIDDIKFIYTVYRYICVCWHGGFSC